MCVHVAQSHHPAMRNLFRLRRVPANKHPHIVSLRSAAASLPRRDVNVARIAANAVPIAARSLHCPTSRFQLKWIENFCRGGWCFCFRLARKNTDWTRGAYVQSSVNHRSSGCRNSTERRWFCGLLWVTGDWPSSTNMWFECINPFFLSLRYP